MRPGRSVLLIAACGGPALDRVFTPQPIAVPR